jgi:altronate dehydratase
MAGDIDLNAGPILDGADLTDVGGRLFDQILQVASGESVKAEQTGHREFMIWSEEGVSL